MKTSSLSNNLHNLPSNIIHYTMHFLKTSPPLRPQTLPLPYLSLNSHHHINQSTPILQLTSFRLPHLFPKDQLDLNKDQPISTRSLHQFPLSCVLSYNSLSPFLKAFTISLSIYIEPTFYFQAIKEPIWHEGLEQELTALELNETWSMVDLPPRKKPITCK